MISVKRNPCVLLVGNFLSGSKTGTRGICEEINHRLVNKGWKTLTTSDRNGHLYRISDMMMTILLKKNIYDVASVDVYSGPAFLWAEWSSLLLQALRKPYILVLHGGGLAAFSQKYPRRVQKLLSPAQQVVTPSLFLKGELQSQRQDIQYLPNALDLSSYKYICRHTVKPRLVWLRALHEIYQPEMAVKVLALLKREFPDIELLMVGPDKRDGSREKMEQTAAILGVNASLNWIGPVPKSEVPQVLNQGDIFLNTTCYESFGVSVMEAAACGLPVVTTNVGELSYLWEDEKEVLLVSPDHPQEMADAVRRILTQPGLAERLSKNARAKSEMFDWSIILHQWEELFLKLFCKAST